MRDEYGLTPRQRLFADRYLETGNAGKSYIDAGYKVKSANVAYVSANQLLRNNKIRDYLNIIMSERNKSSIASAEEVLEILSKMARGEMKEETVSVYQKESRSEIVKKQVSPRDRAKALELLGKRYALYTDRQEVESNNTNVNYVAEWGDEE